MTLKSDSFTFDTLKAQTLVIAPLTEPFLTSDRDVRATSVIVDSRPNHTVLVQTPDLVSFRHLPIQTDNVGHRSDGSVATRVVDQDGIWRPTDRDVSMAPTHGNIETISEKLAFCKYIRDLEFETREVLERETSKKNIENILTR